MSLPGPSPTSNLVGIGKGDPTKIPFLANIKEAHDLALAAHGSFGRRSARFPQRWSSACEAAYGFCDIGAWVSGVDAGGFQHSGDGAGRTRRRTDPVRESARPESQ